MARWVFAALGLLATSALAACGVQTGSSSKTASSPGATQKTITLGATRIEPDDLTMASTDVLTFMNTAVDPLQVEFIKPPSQAGKIGCHVADPKSVTPGETPWDCSSAPRATRSPTWPRAARAPRCSATSAGGSSTGRSSR